MRLYSSVSPQQLELDYFHPIPDLLTRVVWAAWLLERSHLPALLDTLTLQLPTTRYCTVLWVLGSHHGAPRNSAPINRILAIRGKV